MKATELKTLLLAEGCSEGNICIGSCWQQTDIYCLSETDGVWQVYYTERGQSSEPIFESADESEACKFYFDHQMSIQHRHIVGTFREERSADELERRLLVIKITPERNDLPESLNIDHRHRVFVIGKDIFRVKEELGELPITD